MSKKPSFRICSSILQTASVFICLLGFQSLRSQTLTFSQVKMVTTVQTVPDDKVWKIESVASNSAQALSALSSCNASSNSTQISINSTTIHVSARYAITGSNCNSSASGGTGVATTGDLTKLPLWIPAGTTLAAGNGAAFVSVIEFSIE